MLWITWRAIYGRPSTEARTEAVAAVTRSELTAVGEALVGRCSLKPVFASTK
jgi:hypothetical protein